MHAKLNKIPVIPKRSKMHLKNFYAILWILKLCMYVQNLTKKCV